MAMWMVVNCKNGVSSYEIHPAIGVTQKTAWFMDHRIRFALHQQVATDKMGGEGSAVEADETYSGGLARNMHKSVRARKIQGRTGGFGKIAVLGLLDRRGGQSKVRTHVVPDAGKDTVGAIIRDTVEAGADIYTDEHGSHFHLGSEGFNHAFVRHAEEYVRGNVHTNGIENSGVC
jgi:hypothetical protein